MTIGQHKVGRMFTSLRAAVSGGFNSAFGKSHTIPQAQPFNYNGITADMLPPAPKNPFRKRPVKLYYDPNEYHMFRLPSEKHFLLGSFDYNNIFGVRQNTNHSPHLRAQMELDSNLVYAAGFASILLLWYELKRSFDFVTRRENMWLSHFGKYEEADFN